MKFSLLLFFVHTCAGTLIVAQGCSDAGFCTVATMKSEASDTLETHPNRFTLGAALANGEDKVFIVSPYLQYDRTLGNGFSIQSKLTYALADGRLGKTSGFGDLYLTGSYQHGNSERLKWTTSLGVKLPLGNANQQVDSRSLPMVYQPSLGTFDAIVGLRLTTHGLSGTIGLQYPLLTTNSTDRSRSENQFDRSAWPPDASIGPYPSTNGFQRKSDALMKLEYLFTIKDRLRLTPGALAIYHLSNDRYLDSNGSEQTLSGSKGLTLNLVLNALYRFGPHWILGVSGGFPVVTRTSRPDGLTRHFVVTPELRYRF